MATVGVKGLTPIDPCSYVTCNGSMLPRY